MVATAEPPVVVQDEERALTPLTQRVAYGGTGLEVSRLCWGTGLMAHLKHNLPEDEAARILLRGFELGVNFWDTADGYKTHPHVAEALRQLGPSRRADVVINTKTRAKDGAGVTADIDRFLRELGVERLDTVLLHNIETVEEFELRDNAGAMEALQRAKAAGKLVATGISTHLGTGDIMGRCASDPRIQVILTTVNVDGQMLKGSMPEHRARVQSVFNSGTAICLMKTLAQGGLTKTPEMVRDAIRFNLQLPYAHSVCVGVNSVAEVEFAVRVASELE